MIEWMQIIQTARNESPRSASSKYPGITRDGREIRLSQVRIKQLMNNSEISKLVNETQNTPSRASAMAVIIMAFVNGDPELLLKYKALERYWDECLDSKLMADREVSIPEHELYIF